MTKNSIESILRNLRGEREVEILYESQPQMNKTGNPYLGAVKRQHLKLTVGFNYEARASEAEGYKYTAGKRVWGERIPDTPLVKHKDKLYLEGIIETAGPPVYLHNGEVVPESQIMPWIKQRPALTEPLVHPKDFDITRILVLKCNDVLWKSRSEVPQERGGADAT